MITVPIYFFIASHYRAPARYARSLSPGKRPALCALGHPSTNFSFCLVTGNNLGYNAAHKVPRNRVHLRAIYCWCIRFPPFPLNPIFLSRGTSRFFSRIAPCAMGTVLYVRWKTVDVGIFARPYSNYAAVLPREHSRVNEITLETSRDLVEIITAWI